MIIKHYYRVLNPWLQTINVSASSESKALLIFDGCPSHLKIDLLKYMEGDGTVVPIHTTNTSHETNVEDLVTSGIVKTKFQDVKQSLMTESLLLGNTNGLKREYFTCLLNKSL